MQLNFVAGILPFRIEIQRLSFRGDLMLRRVDLCVVCALLLVAAACGGGSSTPKEGGQPAASAPAPAAAAPEAPIPLPGDSTITGRVKFEGTAPTPRVIRMDSDSLCMPEGPNTSE